MPFKETFLLSLMATIASLHSSKKMHILAIDLSVERKKIISLAIGNQLPIP